MLTVMLFSGGGVSNGLWSGFVFIVVAGYVVWVGFQVRWFMVWVTVWFMIVVEVWFIVVVEVWVKVDHGVVEVWVTVVVG